MSSGNGLIHLIRMGFRQGIALGASLLVLGMGAGCATNDDPRAESPEESIAGNAGLGVAAFVGNLAYAPMKLVYAAGGALASGATWLLSGGDSEMAARVLRPAVTGDYVLTPAHLRGLDSVEFVGSEPRYAYQEDELPHVSAGVPARPPSCAALPDYTQIRFPVNQATLGSADRETLRVIASALEGCPSQRFRVEGHADAIGEGPYNFELSLRRARSVKQFLVEEGVDASRLEVAGLGETQPLSTNDTPAGRASNRRVEFAHR